MSEGVPTTSLHLKLTQLTETLRKLEARLSGGTTSSKGGTFIANSDPLVPRDEIQKILSLLQSYADDVQLIGEGDPATFSKMKWRILTEVNQRLASNPATPPKTYMTAILSVMSTMNNIKNVTLSSKDLLAGSFGQKEEFNDGGLNT